MSRDDRQAVAAQWALESFGEAEAASPAQRALRLIEEAVEAAQAVGCDPAQLHRLIDFVYARPVGEIDRELGGCGLTLILFAEACRRSADKCEADELRRVLSKPRAHFTARNEAKNAAGFRAEQASHNGATE